MVAFDSQIHIDSFGIQKIKSRIGNAPHKGDVFQVARIVIPEKEVPIGNHLAGDINFLRFIIVTGLRTATANTGQKRQKKGPMPNKPSYKNSCR